MQKWRTISRYTLAALFVAAGLNHFVHAPIYVRIMPPYVPWHYAMVYISGLAEIALGCELLFRALARWAAWGLIALLIAVFPANLHMALHPELFPEIGRALLWGRLPVQFFLIAWVHLHCRIEPDAH